MYYTIGIIYAVYIVLHDIQDAYVVTPTLSSHDYLE